jgi:hypothetical protein
MKYLFTIPKCAEIACYFNMQGICSCNRKMIADYLNMAHFRELEDCEFSKQIREYKLEKLLQED